MTRNEQYIAKLTDLGYSDKEINFITTDGWLWCLFHGHGRTSYSDYMKSWMGSKIEITIYTDEESYLIINIANESTEIHFFE